MNAINSMPAGSFHQQKTLSNYTTRNEFTEALHILLSCKDIHIPSSTRKLLKFLKSFIFNHEHIGVLNTDYDFIANNIGVSVKTIERAFKWLKTVGLIQTYRTTKQDGTRGKDYKVFAGLATVKNFVSSYVSFYVSSCPIAENPWESKAEEPKNEEHINTVIKTQEYKNKDINRIKENDSFRQPVKKFGIKKEIKAFLQGYAFYNAFGDDLTKHEIEKRVQLAFIKTDMDYTDIDNQGAVKEALRSFVLTYEKENNLRDKDKYFGALYRCLVNALKNQEQLVLESCSLDNCTDEVYYNWLEEKPQEATGAPENDLECYDIQIKQMDEQEQNEEPTEEDYAEAFCYGHPFAEHKPFEIFEPELNSLSEWETPLMPLTDLDELKYYDSIIEQEEEQEEPVKEYDNSY